MPTDRAAVLGGQQLEVALFEGLHGRLAAWRARRPASARGADCFSYADAEAAWHAATAVIAGTPHVRISRDGGRTYPARHARPLPADSPGQPCTVPVYDPGSATGRMLALDLDPAPGRSPADPAAQVSAHADAIARLSGPPRRPVCYRRRPEWRPPSLLPFAAALP